MFLTECYQQLSPWLCMPLDRKSRIYLENHLVLLHEDFARFLEVFVHANEGSLYQHHLSLLQDIWHDARARGSTKQAVSEAYVNALGGLILDVPAWLWEIEWQQHAPLASGWTERSLTVCKMQLHAAIERAQTEKLVAPEIIAELQYQLGCCFMHSAHHQSASVLQTVTAYYYAALQVYCADRYAQQYTKVLADLSTISSNLYLIKNEY